ncbi:hypothetical protein [Clostridium merdae]|uniref:hypothetical protein n=1 Tax=Clostridium merdae TaxID=1958780 RepID=UPI000A2677A9|nr:hypothetical protein [Clostridium merdae]
MLKSFTQSRTKLLHSLPYVVIVGMTVLFLVRSVFGFDWSDETYYLALPYRFALGDRPFLDSWDIHQTGALLIAPILWLYRLVVGDMTGVILFMRIFYICVDALVALLVYRAVFRLFRRRMPALLCAGLFFSFTPFGINNFSYNSMGYLFTVSAAMLVFILYGDSFSIHGAFVIGSLSGILMALACISYPFFIMAVPIFLLALYRIRPRVRKNGLEPESLAPLFGMLCGGAFLLFVAGAYLLVVGGGIWGIHDNVKFLFEDPEHTYQNLFVKTSLFLQDYQMLTILSLLEITLLILILLSRQLKTELDLAPVLEVMIWICMPLSLIVNVGMVLIQTDLVFTSKVNYIQACAGLWPLILTAYRPQRRSRIVIWILYLPSLVLSWAVYTASNNGMTGASYILNLSSLALILIAYDFYTAEREAPAARRRMLKTLWAAFASSLVLLVLCNTVMRAQAVYRDEPIVYLRTQLTTGPAKGLYTTPAAAARYTGLVEDIQNAVPSGDGRVMFNELLPFGYMCSQQRPAPPSLWRVELPSKRTEVFFQKNPQNRPALLYVVKAPYGVNNGTQPVTQRMAEQMLGGSVVMKETEYSYQFTRK